MQRSLNNALQLYTASLKEQKATDALEKPHSQIAGLNQ
jgi:hypothetical protein